MGTIRNPPADHGDPWAPPRAALAAAAPSRPPAGRVIAVMVNFNGRRFLEASIGSALAALKDHEGDLLVVDNASTDDSRDLIRARFPGVALLEMPENTGGSGGFAVGMAAALTCPGCESVWLLDNDILIEDGALGPLLGRLAAEPGCGAVGSQLCLYDRPDLVQEAGGRVTDWLGALRQQGAGGPRLDPASGALAADYLAACSVLIRRDCLSATGPFRPFFVYYDDVDWGLRARAGGWQLRAEPASVVRHCFSGLKPLDPWREYYRKRNRTLFLAMHPPRRLGRAVLWLYLVYLGVLAFRFGRLLDNGLGAIYRQAAADATAGRLGRADLPARPAPDPDPGGTLRPGAFRLHLRRPGEHQAAECLLRARWPEAVLKTQGARTDTGANTGADANTAPQADPGTATPGDGTVLVVDDRIPLAALRPGTPTWQYLGGELRALPRPRAVWLRLHLGLIPALLWGFVVGTGQFGLILRRVRGGRGAGPTPR